MPRRPMRSRLTARTADRYALYEESVQSPAAETAFIARVFRKLRGREAVSLREDFCGTGLLACQWAKRRRASTAVGLDLDPTPLAWGASRHLTKLPAHARSRVRLLRRDVRTRWRDLPPFDAVAAFNFSYFIFKTRDELRAYFSAVRGALARGGVFFLDYYGGHESSKVMRERRRQRGFSYVWDQASFNPITSETTCRIHFEFPDGTKLRNAFEYRWRLWTLPEIRELLAEAGFKDVTVYWEGSDGNGGGSGVFRPSTKGEACASFIGYITAAR